MRRIAAVILALVLAAVVVPAAVAAPGDTIVARPSAIDFHMRRVGTETYKRTRIVNVGDRHVALLVEAALPDDFGFGLLPGSTCPVLAPAVLQPGESCYAVVRFSPSEFFAGLEQHGSLAATATDPDTGLVVQVLVVPVTGAGSL